MNTIPPAIVPTKRRTRRVRRPDRAATPTPTLTLTAASYQSGTSVTLTFDRAVDADGLNGTQIVVSDVSGTGDRYVATGTKIQLDPQTLMLGLVVSGSPTQQGVVMNATADTGIVAADDGGTWAGVTNLPLPFPSP